MHEPGGRYSFGGNQPTHAALTIARICAVCSVVSVHGQMTNLPNQACLTLYIRFVHGCGVLGCAARQHECERHPGRQACWELGGHAPQQCCKPRLGAHHRVRLQAIDYDALRCKLKAPFPSVGPARSTCELVTVSQVGGQVGGGWIA
jgi:hypothetical protein